MLLKEVLVSLLSLGGWEYILLPINNINRAFQRLVLGVSPICPNQKSVGLLTVRRIKQWGGSKPILVCFHHPACVMLTAGGC